MAAAADTRPVGWGSPGLRRATLTLATTQLISWGVLFYGFAVVAPDVTDDTGWSESVVAGAFSVGLLVAGLCAPLVATALTRRDPRLVLTIGSLVGIAGMVLFAGARNLFVLYVAWVVVGLAMAATLYEPAMAVVVALDPTRRQRTLATITVAGGLASAVFAPLGGALVDGFGWRTALLVLAVSGGVATALLHAFVLPSAPTVAVPPQPASAEVMARADVRRLRTAQLFEQAAVVATTTHFVGLLVDAGVTLALGGALFGVMGIGKVVGRLLLFGPVRDRSLAAVAVMCSVVQGAGLAVPLATVDTAALLVSVTVAGAATGATTVLRPLMIVDLVGAAPFAAVSAQLQRATTLARAGAPFALGAGVAAFGWGPAWTVATGAFAVAAERYYRLA